MAITQWLLQYFDATTVAFFFDEHLAETLTAIAGFVTASRFLIQSMLGWRRARQLPLATQERLREAAQYYVKPNCTRKNTDYEDADGGEPAQILNAIDLIEATFRPGSRSKRTLVLAGAGMGKSALLYNLYLRHTRALFRTYQMQLIELGAKGAMAKISSIKDKSETVLLLDALDENSDAIRDYSATIQEINNATQDFYRVVLTCRTQFYAQEDQHPSLLANTGGVASAGDSQRRASTKIFLLLLTTAQVNAYLRRRYLWGLLSRGQESVNTYRKAKELAALSPDMVVRPMLMSYLEFLLEDTSDKYKYSFQIYEAMINGWLRRRKNEDIDADFDSGKKFVHALAVDLVRNFRRRRGYHITFGEAQQIAMAERCALSDRQITGRSLLNVNADGMLKFAHLTIMEVLVARALVENVNIGEWVITEQTRRFVAEIVVAEKLVNRADLRQLSLENMSLEGASLESANMDGLQLRNVDVSGANLQNASLQQVNFEFIDLSGTNLDHATVTQSSLKGARLEGCRVLGTNFDNSDLTGAELTNSTFVEVRFSGARMVGTNLTGAKFLRCNFEGADLSRVRIYVTDDPTAEVLPLFQEVTFSSESVLPSDWRNAFRGEIEGTPTLDSQPSDVRNLPRPRSRSEATDA